MSPGINYRPMSKSTASKPSTTSRTSFAALLKDSDISLHSQRGLLDDRGGASSVHSSIREGIGLLEMSYNSNLDNKGSGGVGGGGNGAPPSVRDSAADGEALTAEEREEVARLPKSTWSTFISPAERKRRAKEKQLEAERKRREAEAAEEAMRREEEDRRWQKQPQQVAQSEDVGSVSSASLTAEEKERAAAISKRSFVSPAERKRAALARRASQEEEGESSGQQAAGEGSEGGDTPAVHGIVKPEVQKLNASILEQERLVAEERRRAREREIADEIAAASGGRSSYPPPPSSTDGSTTIPQDGTPAPFALPPPENMAAVVGTAQDTSESEDEDLDGGPEAPSAVPSAIPPRSTPPPTPENTEQQKRTAIQKVMRDSSLSPQERNAAIQKIIKGEYDGAPSSPSDGDNSAARTATMAALGEGSVRGLKTTDGSDLQDSIGSGVDDVAVVDGGKKEDAPPAMDSSSESESSSGEEESSSGEEESSSGEEWASSSSYETDSEDDEDESKVSSKATMSAAPSASQEPAEAPSAQVAAAALAASILPNDDESESSSYRNPRRRSTMLDRNDESFKSAPPNEEANAAAAVATASAASISQKERAKELEAQLDQELANHAALERERQAQLDREVRAQAALQKSAQAQLEAELDAELRNHAELEREQEARELEFQRRAEEEARARVAAAEEERRKAEEKRLAEENRLQTLARDDEEKRRAEQMRLAREKEELRLKELREEEERRIQALRDETEREEQRIRALREERERQEAQHRIAEEQRIAREEREREQRRLRDEREREQQRLRALQEERERQQRLAEEEQRRLQDNQRRLQEEREREERRLQEQRELHQRLERERMQRSREQEEEQQQEVHAARALPSQGSVVAPRPRGSPSSAQRSLRASQTLASRQGNNYDGGAGAPQPTYASMRPPSGGSQQGAPRSSRYDGVDDDELNWRLDCYVSLSDYTIVVNRARPGPYAPDFDTVDVSGIDFVVDEGSGGSPKADVYYVHKAMIAVGSRRSELLGRRIREAENGGSGSREVNVHETVMLESAANAMGMVLDFCYYHDRPLDINVENAVPLVYLGKRYKIRALLERAESYVMDNIESSTAMYFLLDSYLYRLEDILARAIDVTAANLAETVDFDPIYKLPPELFRRVILSKELKCDSELLSLIVYSYCGEHHAEDIDVEYFRELTKPRIMPDIDPKVALMVLKFYVDLILDDDENFDIMEALQGDSLRNRCVTVIAKHWQGEVCDPMLIDAEWDNHPAPSSMRRPSSHEPAALHRSLPPELQNYLLEKCILAAKDDVDSEKAVVQNFEGKKQAEIENNAKNFGAIVKELQAQLEQAKMAQGSEGDDLRKTVEELQLRAMSLESELDQKTKALEEYRQELKHFRRVPGIHNFGVVSRDDPKIIDKTTCTYSANPDHHYPNHRRGSRRPTQMPGKGGELDNLAKENGYLYDDGKGGLLPVFYYSKRPGRGG